MKTQLSFTQNFGQCLILPEIYEKLVDIRKNDDEYFKTNSSFFPLYCCPVSQYH